MHKLNLQPGQIIMETRRYVYILIKHSLRLLPVRVLSLMEGPGTSSASEARGPSSDVVCVKTYTPLKWTTQEIREAIPARLFERDTMTSLQYLGRDLVMMAVLYLAVSRIDSWFSSFAIQKTEYRIVTRVALMLGHWILWLVYWWFQGLVGMGLWVLAHECGHGAFSSNPIICDTIGFVIHSSLFTPYFSWRISHNRHHINHNSMERDEVYVPETRSDLGIPNVSPEHVNWEDFFDDTPLYTLFMLVRRQLLAFPAYLLTNVSGQKSYPYPTSHFNPNAVLFMKIQRPLVILSNIGILVAIWCFFLACRQWGLGTVLKIYGIPWLIVNHWFVTMTYLHHTDPVIPRYRGQAWTFARGAAATIDRDFLGWQGVFFLHGVSHYHVVHHFFPKMPHYNSAEATKYLKTFLGEHYHYSDEPILKALWHSYNTCQFVEDEGDILFFRDKRGRCALQASENVTQD
ncbi:fatty acid desaturase-domain-containing protein [Irpex rosettiformis]|uniref:Fatty acid desaturase-domain-containing protein n=1 Tax=Irpex rosettiformis TaxID=378272 RepID=A0ACB8U0B3_9APHY|nr:fatty acid desaturase-domain-containing protein [Irpex rosettiformis]